MIFTLKRSTRVTLASVAAGAMMAAASPVLASGGADIHEQHWSFAGMLGRFDKAQLRRGYQVYKNVCSACHGMKRVAFRNLAEPGGPEYSAEQVKAFAASVEVPAAPNDEGRTYGPDGERLKRPAIPSDRMPSPYANDKEAAAAQNGAVPPDLSLIAKARGYTRNVPWFTEPYYWVKDVVTGYQEAGPDYIYALLTGYHEVPVAAHATKENCGKAESHSEGYVWNADENKCVFGLAEGMNYNVAFPGNQIAMVPPLMDGIVDFPEGAAPKTKEACAAIPDAKWEDNACTMTTATYAKDVAAFLMWTAEPSLEARKRLGLKVLLYLIILSGLLYLSKRALWRNVKH